MAAPVVVGWVERVSLPALALIGLAAKIDTGARTSALHVHHLRPVRAMDGKGRPLVDATVPGPTPASAPRTLRLAVVEYAEVRDTSGRRERRPVVETTLVLGPIRRRVRLTLTDRGDMTYPLLVGRTALRGVLVDPVRRFLLAPRLRGTRKDARKGTGRVDTSDGPTDGPTD